MEATLSASFAFLFFLTLGILVASRQRLEDRQLLIRLFVLGFFLRVTVTVFVYLYLSSQGHERAFFPFRDPPFYRDDYDYDFIGWEIAKSWNANRSYLCPPGQNPGYYYTVGIIYFLFGHNSFIARVVNCFFSALTIIYIYLLAKEFWGKKVARLSALLTLFFPEFLVVAAVQWKDTIMTFLVTAGIWNITVLKKKISLHRMILLVGIITYAFLVRKQTGVFLAFLAMFYILIDLRRLQFKRIVIALLIFIAVGIIFNELREFGFFAKDYLYNIDDIVLSYYERAFNLDTSTGLRNIILIHFLGGSLLTRILFLPISIGMALTIPIPIPGFMQYGSEILAPAMWAWYLLLPFFIYGFVYLIKKKNIETSHILMTITYIIVSLLCTGLLASGCERYRLQMMPLAMILVALGILNFRRWRTIYILALLFIFIAMVLYIILKMKRVGWL